MKIALIIITIALLLGLSFTITAGLIGIICLCFGWTFSWKIVLGVWLIICLINTIIPNRK